MRRLIGRRSVILGTAALAGAGALLAGWQMRPGARAHAAEGEFPFELTEEEWRERLSPEAFAVLRGHGTEHPFTSPLNEEYRDGLYHCAGCGQALYSSETKYDSRTGWPSFWDVLDGAIGTQRDTSFGMVRTECHCSNCGGHLGHIFEDGPAPTGLRHCINGVALSFEPA